MDSPHRTGSPLGSGRSPSAGSRLRQKDEDLLSKKDKNFRRYASAVERVLAQFETAVEEWADYISFLGRLLKALQLRPPATAEIPHKHLIAKRLSQCLNPVLPSGVHQKTLEVYGYIFSALGKDGLSDDLSVYLPGLAPTLSFASLSVKPNILAIFETHIVQCHQWALRAALKSLILALLPCLEEENSDEFEWTLRILDSLKAGLTRSNEEEKQTQSIADAQFFWQCLFLTCMTSASRRPGALAYLSRNLPRLAPSTGPEATKSLSNGDHVAEDREGALRRAVRMVASPEPGLLIRCICAGLQDEQALTQRGFLDLLVTHLPLNSPVFQGPAVTRDLEKLVGAATSVVARRDMSLNRRLWSWFLGPEPSFDAPNLKMTSPTSPTSPGGRDFAQEVAAVQIQYFERYGLNALVQSILNLIKPAPSSPSERTKPFRICLSLMDRWEIGATVAPHIFIPCMESVWVYCGSSASKSQKAEVLKGTSTFFDSVESGLIWLELSKVIGESLDLAKNSRDDKLGLVLFVATHFNIREEEMQLVHLPLVILLTISWLQISADRDIDGPGLAQATAVSALKVVQKLLDVVPPRALSSGQSSEVTKNPPSGSSPKSSGVIKAIVSFYDQLQARADLHQPYAGEVVGDMMMQGVLNLALSSLRSQQKDALATAEAALETLALIVRKNVNALPDLSRILKLFASELGQIPFAYAKCQQRFPVTVAKVAVLENMHATPHADSWMPAGNLREVIPGLVAELWPALSPSAPIFNVDAVQCIWRLHALCPDTDLVESMLVTLMTAGEIDSQDSSITLESFRRFTTLWAHSPATTRSHHGPALHPITPQTSKPRERQETPELLFLIQPLFCLLDLLADEAAMLRPNVINWLQSLGSLEPIVDLILERLTELDFVRSISLHARRSKSDRPGKLPELADGPEMCVYYLQCLQHLLQSSPSNMWPALAQKPTLNDLEDDAIQPNQEMVASLSLQILRYRHALFEGNTTLSTRINRIGLYLLRQLLTGPVSSTVVERMIEEPLIEELKQSVECSELALQQPLIETVLAALHARRSLNRPAKSPRTSLPPPTETPKTARNLTVSTEPPERRAQSPKPVQLPSELLDVVKLGISSPHSRPVLDHWISFVNQCLPMYEGGIFQILIPLIECFCTTLTTVFDSIRRAFKSLEGESDDASEPVVGLLLNGLEQSLATAHEALSTEEPSTATVKSPEQPQGGFFGNMVSSVLSGDNRSKSMTANNRLTVLLCFKDAIRVCYSMWTWGDGRRSDCGRELAESYNHLVQRLRNRTRRIFEHLFAAEALECLETLIDLWDGFEGGHEPAKAAAVLDLLNVLEASRPSNTIPALFNAIYSRTNPGALDPARKSTLSSRLADTTLAAFLVAYVRSLEDDAMDEIWADCLTFLRDVLANPMPHRQTLPRLLEFTAALGAAVDRTSFGEQRKVRRELGDLFGRLLAAALTAGAGHSSGLVASLARSVAALAPVLVDADRVAATAATISASVVSPLVRSKAFPDTVDADLLDLLTGLLRVPEAARAARRDVGDAFHNARFFSTSPQLAQARWLPVLRSWSLAEKEQGVPELLARLAPPAAAGLMFGVGAASARREADRRTQLHLRRLATLLLAAEPDAFAAHRAPLLAKLVELLGATAASSPSAATRAEVYMVVRALVLRTAPVHLAALWPVVHAELADALAAAAAAAPGSNGGGASGVSGGSSGEAGLGPTSLLQACKLLDMLLTLGPDDFQLQAWLFVSDTPDAVYRPAGASSGFSSAGGGGSGASVALVDELAAALDATADGGAQPVSLPLAELGAEAGPGTALLRRPLLAAAGVRAVARDELVAKVVHPFFRQLSIAAFEGTYGLQAPDVAACEQDLLQDVFDDSTLV